MPEEQHIGLVAQEQATWQLGDVVGTFHQHAATAAGGVVHAVAGLRVDEFHDQLHDGLGRVELPTLLTGIVSELLDEVLVGVTQHVRLVQVGIAQLVLVEVTQQALQGGVRQHALVTVLGGGEYVLQFGVVRFDGGECLVQRLSDALGPGNQVRPPGRAGEVPPLVFDLFLGLCRAQALGLHQLGNTLLEHIVEALEEQQAEDVVLEVRRVDRAAQDVGRLPEP